MRKERQILGTGNQVNEANSALCWNSNGCTSGSFRYAAGDYIWCEVRKDSKYKDSRHTGH